MGYDKRTWRREPLPQIPEFLRSVVVGNFQFLANLLTYVPRNEQITIMIIIMMNITTMIVMPDHNDDGDDNDHDDVDDDIDNINW